MGYVFHFRGRRGRSSRRQLVKDGRLVVAGVAAGTVLGISLIHFTAAREPTAPTPVDVQSVPGPSSVPKAAARPVVQPISSPAKPPAADAETFTCYDVSVVDGDTMRCGGLRVRLAAIDAPELPGHCAPGRSCAPGDAYASSDHLSGLVADALVRCRRVGTDRFGRTVAQCNANGQDLSCAQFVQGHAIERYGRLAC